MAPRTALDPNELVEVAFIDLNGNRHPKVKLPRALIHSASQRAKQNWLIQDGQIPDPSAPPLPDPVEVIVDEVAADRQAAANTAVDQLRAQLDELQGRLSGQPLSIEELVAFKRELSGYMTQAAMAAAQLAVVEGTGSKIRADLVAIATPLSEQAAVTAEQQAEVATVQQRVLADLQAQAAALLEALSQDVAGALSEAEQQALTTAQTVARSEANKVAQDVAAKHRGASTVITLDDPSKTDQTSFAQRWIGADSLIDGDGALYVTKSGVQVYRFAGGDWKAGPLIEPKAELVSQPISVLDQSSHTMAVLPPQTNGGEGSSPDVLKTFVGAGRPGTIRLAGLDRYAANGYQNLARSCLVSVEVVALDPPYAGDRGSWLISLELDKTGACNASVYAQLGALGDYGYPDLELRSVPNYVQPAGVTGAFPASGTVHLLYLGWLMQAGSPGVPTRVSVSGWCKWNFDDRIVSAAPAWKLSDEI
jgi:hypothetical protein